MRGTCLTYARAHVYTHVYTHGRCRATRPCTYRETSHAWHMLLCTNNKNRAFPLLLVHGNIGCWTSRMSVWVCACIACVNGCVHACVCVCVHTCMHACVCMHVCMHARLCVCVHACMYVCMHACMHLCGFLYPCMHVSMCTTCGRIEHL